MNEISDTVFTFTTPDNVKIFVRRWAPSKGTPKGVAQILHGASEHSLRYESFARFLNAVGYVVYADDHRGHGETAKLAGLKLGVAGEDAWNKIVNDEKQLTEIIKKECLDLPVFLIGHSMGSLLVQDYIERWGSEVNGVVLIGTTGIFPNLDTVIGLAEKEAQNTTTQEPSATYIQIFASFNKPFVPAKTGFEWLSRDEVEVQKYINDPLCCFAFSNGLTIDFLKGLRDMWQREKEALVPKSLPIFIISGSLDAVGGNTLAVIPLIDRYKSQGIQDLTHKFCPEARHEILHEINRNEIQQDILNWLNSHLQAS